MFAVSSPWPPGGIPPEPLPDFIPRLPPPSAPDGPHWWNGPRAHAEEVSPAAAIRPGYPGSCPNTSSIHADLGSPPNTSRWNPIPYTALRMIASALIRLVLGSL